MFDLSHASMIKVQYMSKWCNTLYWIVTSIQKRLKSFLSFVFYNGWLRNHCWLSAKGMTHNFVVFVSVLLLIYYHIGWGMPYLCILLKKLSPSGKDLTSWLSYVMSNCEVVNFPIGILGQVWCMIVSIPNLCLLSFFVTLICAITDKWVLTLVCGQN